MRARATIAVPVGHVCWNQSDVGGEARGNGATKGRWVIQIIIIIMGSYFFCHCLPPGSAFREVCPATSGCVAFGRGTMRMRF